MPAIAWFGGVAFAASLGYLVYFYLRILADPGGEPDHLARSLLVDVALFSVFALHHSVLARTRVKQQVARLAAGYERSLYVWVASALLVTMCLLWQPVPGVVYRVDGVAAIALYAVQLAGGLITLRGAGVVDALELAGIRQVQRTRAHREGQPALQITGPFRFVRHPIYFGWVLMVFAAPLMTANRLLFAVISTTYLILAIPWEERSLVEAHGDQYRAYQRAVRWRVLPGLW